MSAGNELIQADQTLLKNLSLLSAETHALYEEKRLFMREYLEMLVAEATSFESAAGRLLSAYNGSLRELYKSVADVKNNSWLSDSMRNEEPIMIATVLSEKYPTHLFVSGKRNLPFFPPKATVACLKNANGSTLMACEKMQDHFSEWEVYGAENYTEICELVNRDRTTFGILPIENSTNGRLSGFYAMLDKYDLKICVVCDVEDDVNESITRFALVSRGFYRLPDMEALRFIELSSVSTNAHAALSLISAATRFGNSVKRLSSTPLYYRGDSCVDTITFELSEQGTGAFLTYIHLFNKDINVLGYYVQI